MPLSMVTVVGGVNGWTNSDGTVPGGTVVFQPMQPLTGGGYILAAGAVTVPLANGNISKQLANNSQIPGLQYLVTEQIVGAINPAPYVVTPSGTTLDLSTTPRGTVGALTPLYVDLTTAQTISGAKTFNSKLSVQAANLSVQSDGTHLDVVSTGSAQYDGPGVYLWNSAATLGNQAGVSLQAGIADAGATKGYVTFSQLNNTGGWVANLVNFDLNAGTATFSGQVIATGYTTATVSKTASYTATAADSTILGNATAAPITITLPTAGGIAGRQYTVKKTDASVNAVTLGTTAAQTIDGTTTKALTAQYAAFTVQSDGTNWQIIGKV